MLRAKRSEVPGPLLRGMVMRSRVGWEGFGGREKRERRVQLD